MTKKIKCFMVEILGTVMLFALVCFSNFFIVRNNVNANNESYARPHIGQEFGLNGISDNCGLNIYLDASGFNAPLLSDTYKSTNQMEYIMMYVSTTTKPNEYSWKTLKELSEGETKYVSSTDQFGGIIVVKMDSKEMKTSNIKAIRLLKGLQIASYSDNSWGSYPTNGYNIGATFTEDYLLYVTQPSRAGVTTIYNLLKEGEAVDVSVSKNPTQINYLKTSKFNSTGIELTLNYKTLGNIENKITPECDCYDKLEISYDYDFSVSPKVTVKVGNVNTYFDVILKDSVVTSEDASLYPHLNRTDLGRVDGNRNNHLEIYFGYSGFDPHVLFHTEKSTNQFTYIELYCNSKTNSTVCNWYTLEELSIMSSDTAHPYVSRVDQYGGVLMIYMEGYYGDGEITTDNVLAVKLCKGLTFAASPNNHVTDYPEEGYTELINLKLSDDVIVKRIIFESGNNDTYNLAEPVKGDELAITISPIKMVYNLNEDIDLSGMKVKVTYNSLKDTKTNTAYTVSVEESAWYFYGGVSGLLASNAYNVSYNFSEVGISNVTISFGSVFATFEVTVENNIKELKISNIPMSIELGKAPDFSELMVISVDKLNVERVISSGDYTVNVDYLTVGVKTATVSYLGKTKTFEVNVIDNAPESNINFLPGSPVTTEVHPGSMAIRFIMNNIDFLNPTNAAIALYRVDKCSNCMDTISIKVSTDYLGDKLTVGEWYTLADLHEINDINGKPYVSICSQLGDTFLIHMESYAGENASREFTVDSVESIKFTAGFYFVDYETSTWGNENITDYSILTNGILRNDLILVKNSIGTNWIRKLAETDGLTIVSQPNKTVYLVDDTFDTTGMVIHAKYADGFQEDIDVSDYCKYDFSEAGTKAVTIKIFEKTLILNVTVNEKNEGHSDIPTSVDTSKGCGSFINEQFLIITVLSSIIISLIVLKKKIINK